MVRAKSPLALLSSKQTIRVCPDFRCNCSPNGNFAFVKQTKYYFEIYQTTYTPTHFRLNRLIIRHLQNFLPTHYLHFTYTLPTHNLHKTGFLSTFSLQKYDIVKLYLHLLTGLKHGSKTMESSFLSFLLIVMKKFSREFCSLVTS